MEYFEGTSTRGEGELNSTSANLFTETMTESGGQFLSNNDFDFNSRTETDSSDLDSSMRCILVPDDCEIVEEGGGTIGPEGPPLFEEGGGTMGPGGLDKLDPDGPPVLFEEGGGEIPLLCDQSRVGGETPGGVPFFENGEVPPIGKIELPGVPDGIQKPSRPRPDIKQMPPAEFR